MFCAGSWQAVTAEKQSSLCTRVGMACACQVSRGGTLVVGESVQGHVTAMLYTYHLPHLCLHDVDALLCS